MDETPFKWVETLEDLEELLSILENQKEIAVDLEHHDLRSFQGFTCLMQISTRNEDFIVDTLVLRSHLHLLNKVFTDPNIVKVFHGAESDIQWLQKDFGVYIVNLFDTFHASHALEMQSHGLAFLLKHYCDVETNKKFQLADWRIRPLPAEMLKYARMDTHYLLYIYDRMRNEILQRTDPNTKQLLHVVLERSATTSLLQYKKEVYDAVEGLGPNGWRSHLRKCSVPLTAEQVCVFKAVHAWRDRVAREEDESVRFVLPNHMLTRIAMDMPTTPSGVLACCYPIPNLVRMYASDIGVLVEKERVEFRLHAEAKEQMVKELKEAEERRMAEKGVHTRFADEEDEEMGTRVDEEANGTEVAKSV
ncbi:exosome nuclease subunit, partial [Chytridiales sp. JEL 0842]